MDNLIPSRFCSYEHTEEETLQGHIFTSLQKEMLQNELSMSATEKINLELDVNNPAKFAQEEAYHKGRIELLTYLLEFSDTAIATLTEIAANRPPEV